MKQEHASENSNKSVQEATARNTRLIYTPNALTREGQQNLAAVFMPDDTLFSFIQRSVPDLNSQVYSIYVNEVLIEEDQWLVLKPEHNQVFSVRTKVKKAALAIVAIAVLAYFTLGAGAVVGAGAFSGMGVTAATAATMATVANSMIFMAGAMLITKVLSPKPTKPSASSAEQAFSLNGGSNGIRQYEVPTMLLGEVKFAPDYASLPYTWFEGDEQYMACVFHAGLNVQDIIDDIYIGDTKLSEYSDYELFYNGFPGRPSQAIPFYTNPSSTEGSAMTPGGDWQTRTTAANTTLIQADIEGLLYDVSGSGKIGRNGVTLSFRYAPTGTTNWATQDFRIENDSTKQIRRTYSFQVPEGQYDLQYKLGLADYHDGAGKDENTFNLTQIKSIRNDNATYAGLPRIGLKMKATGQLNGSIQELRVKMRARPMPYWNGTAWTTATTAANGLANPGAQLLMLYRGLRDENGRLVAGLGLPDDMIDIEGLKSFMMHCAANGLTYNQVITDDRSNADLFSSIALAGVGQPAQPGGRLGVSYAWDNQPVSGIANMAIMAKGTFSVNYALANAADSIEYTYFDAALDKEMVIRVIAPGVTNPINPSRITGEGVTTADHAGIMARYHMAQSVYQNRSIDFETTLEHMDYRRLDLLSITHDLTKWGTGGRLYKAEKLANGDVKLHTDAPMSTGTMGYVGLRVPGESQARVMPALPVTQADLLEVVIPAASWPADIPSTIGPTEAMNFLWMFDFKSTPGYRVRVVSIAPNDDLDGAEISVVPESDEMWDYVMTGTYVPVNNQSLLTRKRAPIAFNLKVTEAYVSTGDIANNLLTIGFDIDGMMTSAEIWAAPEGQELTYRGRTSTRSFSFEPEAGGNWFIQVRPMGETIAGPVATLYYQVQASNMPPWNYDNFVVQEIAGGMRRFNFSYNQGESPLNLSGAVIKYSTGTEAASWDDMSYLGRPDDVYTASFDTILPPAGSYVFAIRAKSTAGVFSSTFRTFSVTLGENFDQVQTSDPTPPPSVTGLRAVPGFTGVMVYFDNPTYTQGHGPATTIIYAAPVVDVAPSFGDASVVAEVYGSPAPMYSEPATSWHIWAKHKTVDGVLSVEPAGPVEVTTGQDIDKVLEALKNSIGGEQLTPEFNEAIASQVEKSERLEVTVRGIKRREDDEGFLADVLNGWTNRASIKETKSVVAGVLGTLQATWAVEMELDAYGRKLAGGFSLVGTANEESSRIDFGVMANRFWIGAPAGTGIESSIPFVVVTVPEVINGVPVPVGVYMDVAMIKHGSIGTAQIGKAVIDDAHILELSAAKLTVGDGTVGGRLKSANFEENVSGWILYPNGTAEMNSMTLRGSVYAISGEIGGWSVSSSGLTSTNYVAGSSGVRLGRDGEIELRSGNGQRLLNLQATGDDTVFKVPGIEAKANGSASFSGALSAATGTFKGMLEAATGTFSGKLTADAVDAISTVNIAGNAVSVTSAIENGDTGADVWTSGTSYITSDVLSLYVENLDFNKVVFWDIYARGKANGTPRVFNARVQLLVNDVVVRDRVLLHAEAVQEVIMGESTTIIWHYPMVYESEGGQYLDEGRGGRTYKIRLVVGGTDENAPGGEGFVRSLQANITAITLKK